LFYKTKKLNWTKPICKEPNCWCQFCELNWPVKYSSQTKPLYSISQRTELLESINIYLIELQWCHFPLCNCMFYVEINKQVEFFLPQTRASTSQLHFLSHHLKKGKEKVSLLWKLNKRKHCKAVSYLPIVQSKLKHIWSQYMGKVPCTLEGGLCHYFFFF
jgi:hypothetical protein